ncbi:MAG: DegT/DnrJ/EryC1/StrS family aminotransferase, partial [Candidatus Thorarchaeota archaeon]
MKIPYGKQWISDNDIEQVIDVLRSDYLTTGPVIEKFEDAFAKYVGSKF